MPSYVTAAQSVAGIKSGQRIFVHGGAATPHVLIKALTARAPELRGVELVHLHTEGDAPYVKPGMAESFHVNALFVAENMRAAIASGQVDYIPIFLSDIPQLFRCGDMPLDVALVHVSPPDRHGFCSLGVSVDIARAAVHAAKHVIAQVNPRMPRTHGDGLIHVDQINQLVECDDPLMPHEPKPLSPVELAIGKNVASLIEDGATLQMGIGAIPDAVLASLTNHKRLGVHSEMFTDGVVDLVERGVITGEEKVIHPDRIVGTFVVGSRRLYDFVDDNPLVTMLDCGYVNNPDVICRNPKVTAINSAIEIDLTGQICADSIGSRLYSGVGGQMDFIRGAAMSRGGKPIIALPSVLKNGDSRIVPLLKPGAGVVTTRAHVHYVVTEHGVASLHGKNLRERARALIAIADPRHREQLEAGLRKG